MRFGDDFVTNLFFCLISGSEVSSVRSSDENNVYLVSVKTVMAVTGKNVKLILILMESRPLD